MELTIKHLDFANNGKVRLTRLPHWDFENVSLQDCELAFNSTSKEPYLRYKGVAFGLDQIKCYKLPLSSLTKEITINGETFVPKEKFLILYGSDVADIGKNLWKEIFTDNIENSHINTITYGVVQKLLEWHFVIFGLLENNLAININETNN
jgi:hypothetical protein